MLADVRESHDCAVIFLYVHEAHARDLWPLSPSAPAVHGSLSERREAASGFLKNWPSFASQIQATYVDDMSNELALEYGLWPERVVLLRHGHAEWASDFELYGARELLNAAHRVFSAQSEPSPGKREQQ